MQILAVVVRYKMQLEQSPTIRSLCRAFAAAPALAQQVGIFLWDNSPEPLTNPELPIPFEYRHTGENLGVSGAYNRAMTFAESQGIDWILTLDQDTTFDQTFLERMLALSRELAATLQIASIVPFVRSHGQLVSPCRLAPLNRVFAIDRSVSGVLDANGYAINSASLMRVSALREIGGYSEVFWLDLSDVYAFQRIRERGGRMYVAGDLELEHSIVGANFAQDMVPERYRAFLAAENLYLALYSSRFENAFQLFRLLMRAVRQYLSYRDKRYAAITWALLRARLFRRPARLKAEWREFLLKRRSIPAAAQSASAALAPERPA